METKFIINKNPVDNTIAFLASLGAIPTTSPSGSIDRLPVKSRAKDFCSELVRSLLKVKNISPGCVTCSFTVVPAIANWNMGLNGGVVGMVAERVAVACRMSMGKEEKEMVIGELRMSYLSAASINAELMVEGTVMKSGRNTTVVSVEFRAKETNKLFYASQVTFFHSDYDRDFPSTSS